MLSLAELLSNIQVVVFIHHSPGELICMVITNLMLHGSIIQWNLPIVNYSAIEL